jgi:hypothetical protein
MDFRFVAVLLAGVFAAIFLAGFWEGLPGWPAGCWPNFICNPPLSVP